MELSTFHKKMQAKVMRHLTALAAGAKLYPFNSGGHRIRTPFDAEDHARKIAPHSERRTRRGGLSGKAFRKMRKRAQRARREQAARLEAKAA